MPLISQVKIDLMLTNISIQFKNPGFIAEDVMPIIPVDEPESLAAALGNWR